MIVSKQKFQIDIRPGFIVFLCAYYYFDPAESFFPFLFSVTAHEAGHLLALYAFHVPIQKLTLTAGGAVLETPVVSYRRELIAAAMGPAINLLLFLVLIHAMPMFSLINFFLLAYNMLPFYPLDGGRILRAILSLLCRPRTAKIIEKCITVIGMLFLVCFCVYLTCVWHAGLWPVLLCAVIMVKIGTTVSEKELFYM